MITTSHIIVFLIPVEYCKLSIPDFNIVKTSYGSDII